MSAEGMSQWLEALDDLSDQQFVAAMKAFARESTEFPTPAAVRRYAGAIGLREEERAKLAWSVVTATIRDRGAYVSVDFSDRLVNATIRGMGGWERLCGSDPKEMVWVEKRFVELYTLCARAGNGNGSHLPGIAERENGGAREKPLAIECNLPAHAMQRRLPYQAVADVQKIAGPVRKLSQQFAERMQTAAKEKADRKAAKIEAEAERIRQSQAAKQSQLDGLRKVMAKTREEYMTALKVKRERKRGRKVEAVGT